MPVAPASADPPGCERGTPQTRSSSRFALQSARRYKAAALACAPEGRVDRLLMLRQHRINQGVNALSFQSVEESS
jgi:hypothetical protein